MTLADDARSIFHQALAASSIPAAFDRRIRWDSMSLERYDRHYAVAVGKAALPMLEALRVAAALSPGRRHMLRAFAARGADQRRRLLYRRPSLAQPGLFRLRCCCAAAAATDGRPGLRFLSD